MSRRVVALGKLAPVLGVAASVIAVAAPARASSGIDVPEAGVDTTGRGAAWVARANGPLAVYLNPAGMSRQASSVHLGAQLMLFEQCFSRVGTDGEPVSPGSNLPGPGDTNGPSAETCANAVFPNPQLAGVWRINRQLAVGAGVLGPHGVAGVVWPESVDYDGPTETQPAPNRYLMIENNSLLVFPTFSVSYAFLDEFILGAGFTWGLASINFVTFAESVSPNPVAGEIATDDFSNHGDARTDLSATDLFIPGFVVGGMFSPSENFDIGAWFRWSDAVRASTNVHVEANYWLPNGLTNDDLTVTDRDDVGTLKFQIPMEAKIGLRYHQPRADAKLPDWAGDVPVTDPMSQDEFDVEFDVTWAHNSAVEDIEVRFTEAVVVNGTPGSLPENADIPHNWKDVIGFRLGGEYVAVPNLLALRAGGFFETGGQDDEYLNLDFHLGEKIGFGLGGTVRLGPVDLSLAFQHVFFGALDNEGQGQVFAISGDATSQNRSRQPVNGGRHTASLNEIALGGTLHF